MSRVASFAVHTVRKILYLAGSGIVGGSLVGVGFYIYHLENRPDLQLWHLTELDSEYSVARDRAPQSFEANQELEDRLYQELDTKVRKQLDPTDRTLFNRYNPGSRVDPRGPPINWNRSFEFPVEKARAGALMLHGLSDSPYSMRALAKWLNERGVWVLSLRIPGHGTISSSSVIWSCGVNAACSWCRCRS
jgi:hypothetical protein